MTPTARTLAYLRKEGWQAAVVEKYMKFGNMAFGRRVDVWNWGDLLACHPGAGDYPAQIALIQTTSSAGANARRRKLLGKLTEADLQSMDEKERAAAAKIAETVRTWIRCGGVVMLISWGKRKVDGRERWTERVEMIQLQRREVP